jgi:hypothetical protein
VQDLQGFVGRIASDVSAQSLAARSASLLSASTVRAMKGGC